MTMELSKLWTCGSKQMFNTLMYHVSMLTWTRSETTGLPFSPSSITSVMAQSCCGVWEEERDTYWLVLQRGEEREREREREMGNTHLWISHSHWHWRYYKKSTVLHTQLCNFTTPPTCIGTYVITTKGYIHITLTFNTWKKRESLGTCRKASLTWSTEEEKSSS